MERITFDFALRPGVVQRDRKRMDFSAADRFQLGGFAEAKIFIHFEKHERWIVFESPVLDGLLRLQTVLVAVDSGGEWSTTASATSNS